MKLNVYLNFPGTCEEALQFYQSILGGELTPVFRYEGSPAAGEVGEEWGSKVMHGSLKIENLELMGSDLVPDHYTAPQGTHVSINVEDPEEAARIFSGLAEGANITMPLEKTFWAQKFGMLVDRYGIGWMVNCE